MENLTRGKFYGNSKKQFHINGLTIVDSEFYHYTGCPWHYHQDAHFAFTTKGNLTETHKSRRIQLSAGCLLYNHSQEPHCNGDYSDNVAALHIDIDSKWFNRYDIDHTRIEGLQQISNPVLKNNFFNIFREVKQFDNASPVVIEGLIVQSVNALTAANRFHTRGKPSWTTRIKELLYDRYDEKLSLEEIALVINIHPVYLCQQFPVYFNCSFGEYIRKIRIGKAVEMILHDKEQASLTAIAYACGFSDQSHFTRLFKKNIGITPFTFRKMISRK